MRKKEALVVLGAVRNVCNDLPEDLKNAKVYHEGTHSYGWRDIISEIERGSDFGNRYVAKIVARAQKENLSVLELLNQTRQ